LRGPDKETRGAANFSQCQCKLGAISRTAGDSWGKPFIVRALPDPVCQGCMVRQQLGGGKPRWLFSGPNTFAAACTNGSGGTSYCAGVGAGQHGRCCMSVWHSEDSTHWGEPTLVDSGMTAYSSVTSLTPASLSPPAAVVVPEVGVVYEKSAEGCVGASCRICFARVALSLKSDDAAWGWA
jgi:hypothetical protein